MIYGSVCSGIECASIAFAPLGWSPAFFSEIDPFAATVPEQIDRLEEWERFVSDASKQGHMSFFTLVNDPVMAEEWAIFKASGGKAARGRDEDLTQQFGVRRMVEWAKTDRGGRQYSLLARDIGTACNEWGLCG